MGKRSSFERRERDYYPTPASAVKPLLSVLGERFVYFAEPCAGDGALIDAIEAGGGVCHWASDIEPKGPNIRKRDFRKVTADDVKHCNMAITNPPWEYDLVCELLSWAAARKLPIWLLLQADFAHNKRSANLLRCCERIVSVGRVKWIPDSPHTGKDNCAWYLFQPNPVAVTAFYGRAA